MAVTTKAGAAKRGAAAGATKAGARAGAAKGGAAKRAATKRAPAKRGADKYTDPALRERLKRRIMAGTKGGRAGQWSARKAQLLAHEYEAQGGGYKGPKTETQRHLDEWTREEWTTADGASARRGGTTARYLPKKAWEELTPAERRSTDKKKRAASKRGEQFVANTARAAAARRDADGAAGKPGPRLAAKRSAAKRPTTKRATAERAPAKRAPAKQPATKRPAAQRPAAKRPAAKRASAKVDARGR
jgi:hypothetical protein